MVVKVQNPDAERTFRDVFALKVVVDNFFPQISVAFDEIEKQFATEFDYRGELKNAEDIRNNLKKAGFDDIIVPKVYPEYSSAKVLVMEEVKPATPAQCSEQAGRTYGKEEGGISGRSHGR